MLWRIVANSVLNKLMIITISSVDDQMKRRTKKNVLPRPAAMHHMVEDFLTLWNGPLSHMAPLRHFLDHITASDLRTRFAQQCFMESMTHQQPSAMCADQYVPGQGLTATPDMVVVARESGIYTLWGGPDVEIWRKFCLWWKWVNFCDCWYGVFFWQVRSIS